jgi:Cu-Zn family superoxide dismutase
MQTILFLSTLVAAQRSAYAEINPDIALQNQEKKVSGNVTFTQESSSSPVSIRLYLEGLEPNSIHGWHVHVNPIQGENCTTAGLHFNPENKDHGAPTDENRHFGDLGNFVVPANGLVDFSMQDSLLNLYNEAERSPLTRGIVIHALEDDLGKGNAPTSKTVGNSGARLACGNLNGSTGPQETGAPTQTEGPTATKLSTLLPSWTSSSTETIPMLALSLLAFL